MAEKFLDKAGLQTVFTKVKTELNKKLNISDSLTISVETVPGQIGKRLKFSKVGGGT